MHAITRRIFSVLQHLDPETAEQQARQAAEFTINAAQESNVQQTVGPTQEATSEAAPEAVPETVPEAVPAETESTPLLEGSVSDPPGQEVVPPQIRVEEYATPNPDLRPPRRTASETALSEATTVAPSLQPVTATQSMIGTIYITAGLSRFRVSDNDV